VAAFESERIALHVMMLVATALNSHFQAKVESIAKLFVEIGSGKGFQPGPVKTCVCLF
jgi:hypothetical protein